jgi:hypothetical protein
MRAMCSPRVARSRPPFALLALLMATCVLRSMVATAAGPDIEAAPPAEPRLVEPLAPAAPRAAAPPKTRLDVEDLDALAKAVEPDALVEPVARHLATKRKRGIATMVTGTMIGALVLVGSVTFLAHHDCSSATESCSYSTNWPLLFLGAGTMGASTAIGFALIPRRADTRGVVDLWNARHPDERLTLDDAAD